MNSKLLKRLLTLTFSTFFAGSVAFAANGINTVQATNPSQNNTPLNSPLAAPPANTVIIPPPPAMSAKSYVLMDYNTGQILSQKNMHAKRAPASLTKLMTLYIVFSGIDTGQISLNDKVQISKKAWKTGGSRMFINAGSFVPVKDLITGVIVDSGNDATVALAQYIAGSTKAFVPLMNQEAKALGMTNTHYSDVDGLPIADHYSTAYDLALLTRAIIHNFPNLYHFFKIKTFRWDHITQNNRNWLLFRDPTVDGLKTGHTEEAGYCLISSAIRNNMRLISVVMGAPTEVGRVTDSERLLNYGYRFYTSYKIYEADKTVTQTRVWGGANAKVALGLSNELYLVIPKGEYNNLKINVQLNQKLKAPVQKGQTLGTISVSLKGKLLAQRPLIALNSDAEGGLWTRFSDYIAFHLHNWFGSSNKQQNA